MTTRSVLVGMVGAAALLAGACASGNDAGPSVSGDPAENGDDETVVAEVDGVGITRSELETAMADAGVLDYLRVEDPGDDLEGSDAARAVLGAMIDRILLDEILQRHGVEVDDETVARAEEATAPVVEDLEGAELHQPEDPHPVGILAEELADELALDGFLRDEDNAETVARELFALHPATSEVTCGTQLAVQVTDADAVRERIAAGYSLADAATGEQAVASTAEGSLGTCLTEADVPAAAHRTVLETEVGQIGEVSVFSPSAGEVVTLFVEPTEHRDGTDDEVNLSRLALGQRLADSGAHAYEEITYAQTEVEVDPAFGRWDEHGGVVPADAAGPQTFERTGTTTTTTTTTTTAPPALEPPAPAPSGDQGGLGGLVRSSDPGTGDPLARGRAALESGVPGSWRGAIAVQLSQIGGSSSYSSTDGSLELGSHHLLGDWSRLVAITSHEFGHHIAFRYGTQAELGAAPEGWPTSGSVPVEHWADCVSRSFTGYPLASHHQAECGDPGFSWTANWTGPGPDAHPRTG